MKPNWKFMRTYADGERQCPICKDPLAAHETWPGSRYRFCGKPECVAAVKGGEHGNYFDTNERKCEGPDCNNFLPEGRYERKSTFYTCCGKCWVRRNSKGNRPLVCGCGCGEEFLGQARRKPFNGLFFKSQRHFGDYQHKQYLIKSSGCFYDLIVEYLEGFVKIHYSESAQFSVSCAMGSFFAFLTEQGITSIEDPHVTPKTITDFQIWRCTNGRNNTGNISYASTFFSWAAACGYRKAGNPVIPLIHRKRQPKRAPRPLKDDEVDIRVHSKVPRVLEPGDPQARTGNALERLRTGQSHSAST